MTIKLRLIIMVFLQFFIWGSWLVTLGSYMIKTLKLSGGDVGSAYSALGIAALFMPALIGIIADRWIRANWMFALCHLVGAYALYQASTVTDADMMFWYMLLNAMVYMPTIALSNTLTLFCVEKFGLDTIKDFPAIRVWGTVGFIIAMWLVSLSGLELSKLQLIIASASSVLLAIYALTLPDCPTSKAEKSQSWISSLGLDAIVMFKQPRMAVFLVFAMLLGASLQITNMFGSPFLHDFALIPEYQDSLVVKYPNFLLSVSQMSEVCFILAIPFFMGRYGIKTVMLISMIAWTLRFVLFAYGDPTTFGIALLLLSMIVYGCAFDFFNISGAIYMEQEAEPRIRASAQGLFMTMVNGIGAYAGSIISGLVVDHFTVGGVRDWQNIWLTFGSYTLILAVVFIFAFQYKHVRSQP